MSTESEQLYKEFLEHYDLDEGLYCHALELSKPHFIKIEQVMADKFGDTQFAGSSSVPAHVKMMDLIGDGAIVFDGKFLPIIKILQYHRLRFHNCRL